jgi:predicted AAA+ superfamily ATPase
MRKEFNITGICNPDEHYMMDDSRRFSAIIELVEQKKYFTINRPRQYGKTTMLFAITRQLQQSANR